MSYFDSILEKRNLESCPLPLWKLKITDDEYKELREILEKRTHFISDEPFNAFRRECTLFFAEFWHRKYVDGKHSKQMVYDALESTRKSVNFCEDFYDKARKGAKMLKIEQYDGGRADPLNSMFYQGGLPMKLVTADVTNSLWDRFTRGLVNRRIDFDELNLGLVASQSQCLKDYCDQMIVGIETEQYMLMPFYCANEYDSWFVYLKELAKQEKRRQRQLHPFSLDWEFRVGTVEHKIYTKYVLKGGQRLPAAFLEDEGLNNLPFFSIQVRVNGKAVDTFDYVHNFCRYAVVSKHPYYSGDKISLILNENEEPYINGDLDMTVPHILYRNKDGKYELGNHIGKQQSLLLIPEGWNVDDELQYEIERFTWGDNTIRGISIPTDFKDDITVKGIDGIITFGMNAPMYWTELITHPVYQPDVEESLYDTKQCRYKLNFDTEDGTKSISNANIQYRNKWQDRWDDTPSYGEIYARAVDCNGHFVTPIRLINIGDGLTISLQNADSEKCQIIITWPHGRVMTNEGTKKANDIWEIKKENCSNKNKILFIFIPEGNSRNQFTLSIKAPFKEFSIINLDCNPVSSDSWIPYTDLDKYLYHLVGQDVKEFTFGNIKRELRWLSDKLYIVENGTKIKAIPYEGNLLTLFGSREIIRAMLERTSQNMLNAIIPVTFITSDYQKLSFEIKDSPFRPKQLTDGKIVITTKGKKLLDFKGALKLLKLEDPALDPIVMTYDEENGYILPEAIRSWEKTILIGRTRGRICPALVDLTREIDSEYRANNREIAIATISENLQHSTLGDELWQRIIGWFNCVQKEDIPASSLLELYCVAQNADSLLCLAFQLYAQYSDNEERDTLSEQLKSISNDLAFQWYWLSPYLKGVMLTINKFVGDINNAVIRNIYIKWALLQGESMALYLGALNDENEYSKYIGTCLCDVLTSFIKWMEQLCISSMVDSYGSDANEIIISIASSIIMNPNEVYRMDNDSILYIDSNQDYINEATGMFFTQYNEPGTINEQWMYKRVNAVLAHYKKSVDLFSQSEEIRRSIIYCIKSCNEKFLVALNNKIADSKYEVRKHI